jgi:hypothetical protein
MLLLALATAVAAGSRATAAEAEVIDDWRKVGAPDLGAKLVVKARLTPAAAEKLVAAIDEAWRRPPAQRPRADGRVWIVENLRYAFLGADGRPTPLAMGGADAQRRDRELLRTIEILGSRPSGGHTLLLLLVHSAYDESGDAYGPSALGVVFGANGKVTDVAALTYGFGDACYADSTTLRVDAARLHVADRSLAEGVLCREPIDPEDQDCCTVDEGSSFDLEVGLDGRFVERGRRHLKLSGQFEDPKTAEEIRIEEGLREQLRLGYRARAGIAWKAMKIVSVDRAHGVLVAKFEKSPVIYTLTLAEDGRSLASAGSDGSKPQRFVWIPESDRYRREPKR